MTKYKDRITKSEHVDPNTLTENPHNYRIHTDLQTESLDAILKNVGWVSRIMVNQNTGRIINGHLRVSLAIRNGDEKVPVDYVDLTEKEENLILSTFDPITGFADSNSEILDSLLRETVTDDPEIMTLLDVIAKEGGVTPPSFEAGSEEDQGQLDEKKKIACPECGHEFTP